MRECAAAGVRARVAATAAAGDGAVSGEAVAAAREHGMEVVDRGVPLHVPARHRCLPPPARPAPPDGRPPGGLRVRPSLRLPRRRARRPDPRRGARRPRDGRCRGPQRRRDADAPRRRRARATRADASSSPRPLVDARSPDGAARGAPLRRARPADARARRRRRLLHARARRRSTSSTARRAGSARRRPTTTSATRRSWRACRTSPRSRRPSSRRTWPRASPTAGGSS